MTDENPRKLFHHEATRRTVQRDVDGAERPNAVTPVCPDSEVHLSGRTL